ncbi:MAG: hypothetical protein E7774_09100 [Bradyrhizobium sp.]|nr:MAG: hypothetical protein E7774_09100 [Bradyrhizobium sp.]
MSRTRIPGLIDVLRVDDPAQIAALSIDARLDRNYIARGPLLNRIVAARIRRVLSLNRAPLPPVAPRGAERPTAGQAALETRLSALALSWRVYDPAVGALARYVRGAGALEGAGPLAQDAVGRLFRSDYKADAQSWAAAEVLDKAPRTFNPFLLLNWALTRKVAKARRLLADKVGGDPAGLHGTAIAIHNLVASVKLMRSLWADPQTRRRLSPEAAGAQCLIAPEQVVRQPREAGNSIAGDFDESTLVLLQLRAAQARSPGAEMAFLTGSWSRCPAHTWIPALLAEVWRAATASGDPR